MASELARKIANDLSDNGKLLLWSLDRVSVAEIIDRHLAEHTARTEAALEQAREALEAQVAKCRRSWRSVLWRWDAERRCHMVVPHDEGCDGCRDMVAALAAIREVERGT